MSNYSRAHQRAGIRRTQLRRGLDDPKARSPIKSRPARSGAVTTSPVRPTNLSEGTCPSPCGFGSERPGTPPFRFSQLWVRLFHCFEGVHREVALQIPERYI